MNTVMFYLTIPVAVPLYLWLLGMAYVLGSVWVNWWLERTQEQYRRQTEAELERMQQRLEHARTRLRRELYGRTKRVCSMAIDTETGERYNADDA